MKGKDISKKLVGYGLAAAGMLGLVGNAEASIVYSGPQNITVDVNNSPVGVDLNNDSDTDFSFYASTSITIHITTNGSITYQYFYLLVNPLNGSVIFDYLNIWPMRLSSGYIIRNTLTNNNWNSNWGTLASYSTYVGFSRGNFVGNRGYIGVRFHSANCSNNSWHYGWIQFEAAADATRGTIIDWAYETECDKPILAGQKSYTQSPAPVPAMGGVGAAGLAALLGAAGAVGLRRRKKEKKEEE